MIRLAALLICAAGQASALSCRPHAVQDAYQQAAASDQSYVVIHGTLGFDPALLPATSTDPMFIPESALIPARIVGQVLTDHGFQGQVATDLTFQVRCFATWCGSGQTGVPYLAFIRQDADGAVLETNPCGGFAFANPSPAQLRAIETCHAGGDCTPFVLP